MVHCTCICVSRLLPLPVASRGILPLALQPPFPPTHPSTLSALPAAAPWRACCPTLSSLGLCAPHAKTPAASCRSVAGWDMRACVDNLGDSCKSLSVRWQWMERGAGSRGLPGSFLQAFGWLAGWGCRLAAVVAGPSSAAWPCYLPC